VRGRSLLGGLLPLAAWLGGSEVSSCLPAVVASAWAAAMGCQEPGGMCVAYMHSSRLLPHLCWTSVCGPSTGLRTVLCTVMAEKVVCTSKAFAPWRLAQRQCVLRTQSHMYGWLFESRQCTCLLRSRCAPKDGVERLGMHIHTCLALSGAMHSSMSNGEFKQLVPADNVATQVCSSEYLGCFRLSLLA
jgi:hypothetical protein